MDFEGQLLHRNDENGLSGEAELLPEDYVLIQGE